MKYLRYKIIFQGEQHFVRRAIMMLVLTFVAGVSCNAQNFTVGSLNYTVTSTTAPLTARLTGPNVTDKTTFTGPLSIPATVDYNGNTYTVTSIGPEAFKGCTKMTGILNLPDGITYIGPTAFDNCGSLTGSLILPSGLTTVEGYAFRNCTGLDGILQLPTGLNTIKTSAFQNCSKLNGPLSIPAGVTSIEAQAFDKCSGFTGSLNIPTGLTSIANNTFSGCTGLTGNLVIPNMVTSIGVSAFDGCTGFHGTLTIPGTATTIYKNAFNGCKNLTGTLTLPAGMTTIAAAVFCNCSSLTGTLTLPSGITSIGAEAFSGCRGFTGQLNIPSGVTSIGGSAFLDCSGLTGNIVIPDGVTIISYYVFQRCSGLDGTLTLSKNVTEIQENAFYGCTKLTGTLKLPTTLKVIKSQAFRYCTFTGPLTIPDGVTTIGVSAFSDCKNFSGKLTIPESVTSIGNSAFNGCSGLTGDVVIPSKVTVIDYSTFFSCAGLNSVTIPSTVTAIKVNAFYGCSNMLCKISEGYSGTIATAFTNVKGVWFEDKVPTFTPSDAVNGLGVQTTYYIPEDDNAADAQADGSIKALYQAKIISTKTVCIRYYHLGLKTVSRPLADITIHNYGHTTAGVATLYVNFPALVPSGLRAFYGKEVKSAGAVYITSIDNTLNPSTLVPSITKSVTRTIIPTRCPVVLMGDVIDNDTVFEAVTAGSATAFGTAIEPTGTDAQKGILSGSLINIDKSTVTGGDVYTFGIGNNSGVVGFYPYNGTMLGAHKAYLLKTPEMLSKNNEYVLSIDNSSNQTNAISSTTLDLGTADNAPYYTLQGVRIAKPIKGGIYIHNNKKTIIN